MLQSAWLYGTLKSCLLKEICLQLKLMVRQFHQPSVVTSIITASTHHISKRCTPNCFIDRVMLMHFIRFRLEQTQTGNSMRFQQVHFITDRSIRTLESKPYAAMSLSIRGSAFCTALRLTMKTIVVLMRGKILFSGHHLNHLNAMQAY